MTIRDLKDFKYIDLPIVLGGNMQMENEDFYAIVFNDLEIGSTYLLFLVQNGISLSINAECITIEFNFN